jgi:hypothetical protein
MEKHICEFGCGREAIKQFEHNKKWCCSEKAHVCPAIIEKSIATRKLNHPSRKQKMNDEIINNVCKFCGQPAKFVINNFKDYCCVEKGYNCPEYGKYIGNKKKKWFQEHPEAKEKARLLCQEIQKRPEVQEKKSEAMKVLHNGDCEKCVEFQKNYLKGHDIAFDKNLFDERFGKEEEK